MSWGRCFGMLALVIALFSSTPAYTQDPASVRLEDFVQEVARLWLAADVSAIVDLIPEDNSLTLDTGSGIETANSRHVAAALRDVFSGSETVTANPVRVTVASSEPPRGFGEISWTFRSRGTSVEQSRSVYVAARLDGPGWRITELRIMR